MTEQFWKDVEKATELVTTSGVRRVDGNGFKVYVVPGGITRIDIEKDRPQRRTQNGH